MAQHSHEHTHEVANPGGTPVHGDLTHTHGHDDGMNEHHYYTEEPAVAVMGPITPGEWSLATADQVDQSATECPAYIYVRRGNTEIVVALIGEAVGAGSWEVNAKVLVSVPALVRFVQHVADQDGGGVIPLRDTARALIEEINQVEVPGCH